MRVARGVDGVTAVRGVVLALMFADVAVHVEGVGDALLTGGGELLAVEAEAVEQFVLGEGGAVLAEALGLNFDGGGIRSCEFCPFSLGWCGSRPPPKRLFL